MKTLEENIEISLKNMNKNLSLNSSVINDILCESSSQESSEETDIPVAETTKAKCVLKKIGPKSKTMSISYQIPSNSPQNSSEETNILVAETSNLKSKCGWKKIGPKSKTMPMKKIGPKSKTMPMKKIGPKSKTMPMKKIGPKSKTMPMKKIGPKSKTMPMKKIGPKSKTMHISNHIPSNSPQNSSEETAIPAAETTKPKCGWKKIGPKSKTMPMKKIGPKSKNMHISNHIPSNSPQNSSEETAISAAETTKPKCGWKKIGPKSKTMPMKKIGPKSKTMHISNHIPSNSPQNSSEETAFSAAETTKPKCVLKKIGPKSKTMPMKKIGPKSKTMHISNRIPSNSPQNSSEETAIPAAETTKPKCVLKKIGPKSKTMPMKKIGPKSKTISMKKIGPKSKTMPKSKMTPCSVRKDEKLLSKCVVQLNSGKVPTYIAAQHYKEGAGKLTAPSSSPSTSATPIVPCISKQEIKKEKETYTISSEIPPEYLNFGLLSLHNMRPRKNSQVSQINKRMDVQVTKIVSTPMLDNVNKVCKNEIIINIKQESCDSNDCDHEPDFQGFTDNDMKGLIDINRSKRNGGSFMCVLCEMELDTKDLIISHIENHFKLDSSLGEFSKIKIQRYYIDMYNSIPINCYHYQFLKDIMKNNTENKNSVESKTISVPSNLNSEFINNSNPPKLGTLKILRLVPTRGNTEILEQKKLITETNNLVPLLIPVNNENNNVSQSDSVHMHEKSIVLPVKIETNQISCLPEVNSDCAKTIIHLTPPKLNYDRDIQNESPNVNRITLEHNITPPKSSQEIESDIVILKEHKNFIMNCIKEEHSEIINNEIDSSNEIEMSELQTLERRGVVSPALSELCGLLLNQCYVKIKPLSPSRLSVNMDVENSNVEDVNKSGNLFKEVSSIEEMPTANPMEFSSTESVDTEATKSSEIEQVEIQGAESSKNKSEVIKTTESSNTKLKIVIDVAKSNGFLKSPTTLITTNQEITVCSESFKTSTVDAIKQYTSMSAPSTVESVKQSTSVVPVEAVKQSTSEPAPSTVEAVKQSTSVVPVEAVKQSTSEPAPSTVEPVKQSTSVVPVEAVKQSTSEPATVEPEITVNQPTCVLATSISNHITTSNITSNDKLIIEKMSNILNLKECSVKLSPLRPKQLNSLKITSSQEISSSKLPSSSIENIEKSQISELKTSTTSEVDHIEVSNSDTSKYSNKQLKGCEIRLVRVEFTPEARYLNPSSSMSMTKKLSKKTKSSKKSVKVAKRTLNKSIIKKNQKAYNKYTNNLLKVHIAKKAQQKLTTQIQHKLEQKLPLKRKIPFNIFDLPPTKIKREPKPKSHLIVSLLSNQKYEETLPSESTYKYSGVPIVIDVLPSNISTLESDSNIISVPSSKIILEDSNKLLPKLKEHTRCNLCNKWLLKYQLQKHMSLIHPNNDFMSRNEFKKLKLQKKKKAIIMEDISHEDELSITKCQICSKLFLNCDYLRKHQLLEHDMDIDEMDYYPCELCTCMFETEELLDDHIINIHDKEEHSKLSCAQCSDTFDSEELLCSHILNKHSTQVDLSYQCEHCLVSFETQELLQEHIKMLHELYKILPLCKECYLCNDQSTVINVHCAKYQAIKDKQVPLSFQSLDDLREYIGTTPTEITQGISFFECPNCPLVLNGKDNFELHKVSHEKTSIQEINTQSLPCKFCQDVLIFNSVRELALHYMKFHNMSNKNVNHINCKNCNCKIIITTEDYINSSQILTNNLCELCEESQTNCIDINVEEPSPCFSPILGDSNLVTEHHVGTSMKYQESEQTLENEREKVSKISFDANHVSMVYKEVSQEDMTWDDCSDTISNIEDHEELDLSFENEEENPNLSLVYSSDESIKISCEQENYPEIATEKAIQSLQKQENYSEIENISTEKVILNLRDGQIITATVEKNSEFSLNNDTSAQILLKCNNSTYVEKIVDVECNNTEQSNTTKKEKCIKHVHNTDEKYDKENHIIVKTVEMIENFEVEEKKEQDEISIKYYSEYIGQLPNYPCTLCNITFKKLEDFETHIIIDHIKCKLCDFIFKTNSELNDHILCHDTYRIEFYSCTCNQLFPTFSLLETHIHQQHTSNINHYFKHFERNITKRKLNKNDKIIQCIYCINIFNSKLEYVKHIQVCHSIRICKSCSVLFNGEFCKGDMCIKCKEHDDIKVSEEYIPTKIITSTKTSKRKEKHQYRTFLAYDTLTY